MRATIEFRIPEAYAQEALGANLGERLGDSVRKIVVGEDELIVRRIGELDRRYRASGKAFFTCWNIRRSYSAKELAQADLLHLRPRKTFEPAGEECGTRYDESVACPECGAGARQDGPLFLDERRIPRDDIAQTIAGEVVVSARLVEAFRTGGLKGARFQPVSQRNRIGSTSAEHFQLIVEGPEAEVAPAMRFGESPFDAGAFGRCSRGHLAGLNRLTEVSVLASSIVPTDVMATRQTVGVRRGLLRPQPLLLLSPKAAGVLKEAGLKGAQLEIARIV